MTKLNPLRSEITRLRRRRSGRRAAIGWVALAIALLWALLAVFVLDLYFDLSAGQRLLVMLFAAGAVTWAWFRFTRPWLGVAESQIDVALMVEHQQGIESDLVAALQFESPEAARWGSRQLEDAVIDCVASLGRGISLNELDDNLRLLRRSILLAITCIVLLGIILYSSIFAPGYMGAFLNRLAFGGRHYPSDTLIHEATVNGQTVDLQPGAVNQIVSPVGYPLEFRLVGGGSLPPLGHARLRSRHDGQKTEVPLEPLASAEPAVESSESAAESAEPEANATETTESPSAPAPPEAVEQEADQSGQAVYAGKLSRLMENVELQFYLGDAYTDPVTIEVIPLPAVTAHLEVTLPEYAANLAPELAGQGLQQSAVEGSRVELTIEESSKPLESAWVTVHSEPPLELSMTPIDEDRHRWRLPSENTPFANIAEPLHFELDVTDRDGQHLASPLAGHVRIQADGPPRVLVTSMVHHVVLPTARPVLTYSVLDDYGIAAIDLVLKIERLDGTIEEQILPLHEGLPIMADQLPLEASLPIELSRWGLQPGEHVHMLVQVTDHRGDMPGEQANGESLVLAVADRSQLYAAISESDLEAEEIMTSIIDQHIRAED